jgi:hypothetical protein
MGQRMPQDAVAAGASTFEREISVAIERSIFPKIRAHWVEQLFDVRALVMPCIKFLQEPPGALTPSSITRQSEKVRKLFEMEVAEIPYLPGTEKYWQMYGFKMRNQRPSRFARRKEPRRSIELVGFLHHSLAAHTDTLIRMVDRRVSQLWGRARTVAGIPSEGVDLSLAPMLLILLVWLGSAIFRTAPSTVLFLLHLYCKAGSGDAGRSP